MAKKAFTEAEVNLRKNRIMDEASKIMANEGLANFSMRKLSAAVGMTATNIYNYFPNKHDLCLQTTLRGFDLIGKQNQEALAKYSDPREQLTNVLKSAFYFAQEFPGYWELMFHPPMSLRASEDQSYTEHTTLIREKTASIMKQVFELLSEYYGNQTKGVLDPKNPIKAITLLTNIHGLIDLYNHKILDQFYDGDPDELANLLIQQSIDLLIPEA